MRIKHSIKNIKIGVFTQVVMILLGFISRKVFIDSLGTEYLGINGIMTNVISIMGLVESGIGISIVYSLYKPLAENNRTAIIGLVQLYRKLYRIIAIIIFSISMVMFPIILRLVKDTNNSVIYIGIVFLIFLLQNMLSYIFAYKISLIDADQKGYKLTRINLIFQVVSTVIKILILKVFSSYIVFLLIGFISLLIQNIVCSKIVDKEYPFIKTQEKYSIDSDVKKDINKNVRALFLANIGTQMVFGTDNLLISAFVNVTTVGLYSNYTLVINQLSALFNPIIHGIGASVGNLIAVESKERTYFIFKITFFVNFIIYSFCSIVVFNVLEPFIDLWLGTGFLLDKVTFLAIIVNFYLTGMRASINIFRSKAGTFTQDKYMPLVEAVINLVASVILVRKFGLIGIFMGTTISSLAIPIWNSPRIAYKVVFDKPVFEYFITYIKYIIVTCVVGVVCTSVCNALFTGYSFISIVGRGLTCSAIIGIIYLIIFLKSEELKYLFEVLKNNLPIKR